MIKSLLKNKSVKNRKSLKMRKKLEILKKRKRRQIKSKSHQQGNRQQRRREDTLGAATNLSLTRLNPNLIKMNSQSPLRALPLRLLVRRVPLMAILKAAMSLNRFRRRHHQRIRSKRRRKRENMVNLLLKKVLQKKMFMGNSQMMMELRLLLGLQGESN